MAMITDSLLDAFTAAHGLGQHAPMSIHEEEQLVHSHRRRRELEGELADLKDGTRVLIPTNLNHARAMQLVASLYIEQEVTGDPTRGVSLPPKGGS